MNQFEYDFKSENQKYDFILDTFFDHMYRCPNCGESYVEADKALNCCHEDCYDQAREFATERNADERMRREKGD